VICDAAFKVLLIVVFQRQQRFRSADFLNRIRAPKTRFFFNGAIFVYLFICLFFCILYFVFYFLKVFLLE